MHRMLGLAAVFGMAAGATGAFLSFLGNNLPTGSLMVTGASTAFGLAFFFRPSPWRAAALVAPTLACPPDRAGEYVEEWLPRARGARLHGRRARGAAA
jgi:hypothetical protein